VHVTSVAQCKSRLRRAFQAWKQAVETYAYRVAEATP
jgi:hypothetical protein